MSSSKPPLFLPVVAAADYRHAVPGELWEWCPVSITGPVEYRSSPRDESAESIMRLAEISMQAPIDFPSIGEAILEGDHVALAVDPSVPRVAEIIAGVLREMKRCAVARVSIVLWSEASEDHYQSLRQRFHNASSDESESLAVAGGAASDDAPSDDANVGAMVVSVTRHAPRDRREMRYVAADAGAEAIYLARDLVDADFAIPIVTARAVDALERLDRANVFPMFADASTMLRFQTVNPPAEFESMAREVGWLLGVQLVMMVSSDAGGGVARIITGTPDAIRGELDTLHAETRDTGEHETRPSAGLVIASLDGDAGVQTWANVARAVIAASRHVQGEGSIVVWSRLTQPPTAQWQREMTRLLDPDRDSDDESLSVADRADGGESEPVGEDDSLGFADWSNDAALARRLAGLLQSYRVFLHSQLRDADVESLGIGVIASVEELSRLGEAFQGAGMLRAAQYHDGSITRLGQSAEQTS